MTDVLINKGYTMWSFCTFIDYEALRTGLEGVIGLGRVLQLERFLQGLEKAVDRSDAQLITDGLTLNEITLFTQIVLGIK